MQLTFFFWYLIADNKAKKDEVNDGTAEMDIQ